MTRRNILAIMPPGDDTLLRSLVERLQQRLTAHDFHAVSGMADAAPYASQAEIIIAFFLSDEVVRQASCLKWVQCVISGTDGVLTPSLPSDVLVTNTRGTQGPPVSEAALGAMLALSRGLPQLVQAQQQRIWNPLTPTLLYGKTVGIVGVGVIAEALAQRCKAMGMTVVGVTAMPRDIPGFDEMRSRSELAVIAADFDYMVVISPLTEDTRGMVNESVLRAMKKTAYLINLGRGAVIDEAALLTALRQKWIAGAALDTFVQEPLPADHPFWDLNNVLLSPHMGGRHIGAFDALIEIFEQNLRHYLAGETEKMINLVQRNAKKENAE